jgi:hypothetical protein
LMTSIAARCDDLAKSRHTGENRVQCFSYYPKTLDSGFRRNDRISRFVTFYAFIKHNKSRIMKNSTWVQIFLLVVSVHLAWDANTEPAVGGYKLYYGKATRDYSLSVDVGKVTDYVLTGVSEVNPIFFAVTAYDTSRNESAYSEELECAVIKEEIIGTGKATITNTVAGWTASTTKQVFVVEKNRSKTLTITVQPEDQSNFVSSIQHNGNLLTLKEPKITIENITGDHLLNFEVRRLYAPHGATVK